MFGIETGAVKKVENSEWDKISGEWEADERTK